MTKIDTSWIQFTSRTRLHERYATARRRLFDDLGVETSVNYFGTVMMPMGDILLARYDYYVSHSMKTMITTNLNSEEIEGRYGKRVRSRLREMMNLIAFPASAKDKRV